MSAPIVTPAATVLEQGRQAIIVLGRYHAAQGWTTKRPRIFPNVLLAQPQLSVAALAFGQAFKAVPHGFLLSGKVRTDLLSIMDAAQAGKANLGLSIGQLAYLAGGGVAEYYLRQDAAAKQAKPVATPAPVAKPASPPEASLWDVLQETNVPEPVATPTTIAPEVTSLQAQVDELKAQLAQLQAQAQGKDVHVGAYYRKARTPKAPVTNGVAHS